jgi:hypothetical protein
MTARRRLPHRRGAVALDIEHADHRYRMHVGYFPDGAVGEVFIDAAAQAMTPWDAPSWRDAAVEYHRDRPGRLAVEIELKRLAWLRRLMADDISIDRAWHEQADRTAAKATVDALTFSLRRGNNELTQPSTLRRLSTLDEYQLEDVCLRVQAFQQRIAPAWSAADVDLLISAWRKFREQR